MTAAGASLTAIPRDTSARSRWLFSAEVDLAVFLGSAALAFALLLLGRHLGVAQDGTAPEWTWVVGVLLVDVAHVWSTIFRVYLDRRELSRRPVLYAAIPLAGWAAGIALHSIGGDALFWRCLAYVAVFHFVRQQWGWVALYRARAGEHDRLGRALDWAAIHLATVYPLLHWHASLPRRFAWFLQGDFVALPRALADVAWPVYVAALGLYVARSAHAWSRGRGNPGKDVVLVTTAACWYVGIVALDSDYAFTVTNVLIHGIPYMALVGWYGRRRCDEEGGKGVFALFSSGPLPFLVVLWLLAYVEELFWHRAVWHDKEWLFGAPWEVGSLRSALVALLVVPQLTHYVLDGIVWKRSANPSFSLIERVEAAP